MLYPGSLTDRRALIDDVRHLYRLLHHAWDAVEAADEACVDDACDRAHDKLRKAEEALAQHQDTYGHHHWVCVGALMARGEL